MPAQPRCPSCKQSFDKVEYIQFETNPMLGTTPLFVVCPHCHIVLKAEVIFEPRDEDEEEGDEFLYTFPYGESFGRQN